MTEFQVT